VWRRTGLAGVLLCVVAGAAPPAAIADRKPKPDPRELWQSYPLEQQPSTVAQRPAAATTPKPPNAGQPASSEADQGSRGPAPGVIAAIGFAATLLVATVIALRRRRRRPAAPSLARAAPPAAPVAAPPAQRAIEPGRPTLRPAAPRPAAPPAPAATPNGRAAARKTPVCQVRWSRDGRCFYAVSVDPDGGEHMLASSPRVEWCGSGPPEETREARAALRTLAKDLRERGWRPLRAKGIDFDERRWYARRFRWPTEAELAEAARAADGDAEHEVAGRTRGSR
jgi:hypothetical protein